MNTHTPTSSADAGHTRLPYESPRLIVHGTLAAITNFFGKNSGAGDQDTVSGGAG